MNQKATGIFDDEFHGKGGCYVINSAGKRVPEESKEPIVPAPGNVSVSTKKNKAAAAIAVANTSTTVGVN